MFSSHDTLCLQMVHTLLTIIRRVIEVIQEYLYYIIHNVCIVSRCAIKLIPHSCCHTENDFMFLNISFNGLLFLFIIINHPFGDRLSIYVGICYYLCIMNIMEAAMYICLWNPQYTNLSLIYYSLGQCVYALYDCMFRICPHTTSMHIKYIHIWYFMLHWHLYI